MRAPSRFYLVATLFAALYSTVVAFAAPSCDMPCCARKTSTACHQDPAMKTADGGACASHGSTVDASDCCDTAGAPRAVIDQDDSPSRTVSWQSAQSGTPVRNEIGDLGFLRLAEAPPSRGQVCTLSLLCSYLI